MPLRLPLQTLFQEGDALMRAIVAAEVLAPPIALRPEVELRAENHFWIQQPNEPSTSAR